jgi:Transposase DDE domain group 1
VKSIAARPRVKVSADGVGVVSHAGTGMLRELAELTGLSAQVTAALADTYRGPWIHAPGAVFADLAAAVAGGVDCIDGVGQRCGDREHVFGPAASTTTMWRLVDERIDAAHLPGIRAARAAARARAWAAGAAPAPGEWLHIDIDATITIDHSDNKEQAAPTWKKTFGHHSLLALLERVHKPPAPTSTAPNQALRKIEASGHQLPSSSGVSSMVTIRTLSTAWGCCRRVGVSPRRTACTSGHRSAGMNVRTTSMMRPISAIMWTLS